MQRRLLIIIAVFAALLLPALAIAAKHHARAYGGKLSSPGAGIELTAKPKNPPATKVTRFEWHNIPTSCNGTGTGAVSGEFGQDMAVANKKFHGTYAFNNGRAKATVNGKFSKKEKKASGTLRVTGPTAGCLMSDTGVVDWQVHQHKK